MPFAGGRSLILVQTKANGVLDLRQRRCEVEISRCVISRIATDDEQGGDITGIRFFNE
jgi:hypothetical protein